MRAAPAAFARKRGKRSRNVEFANGLCRLLEACRICQNLRLQFLETRKLELQDAPGGICDLAFEFG